MKLLYVLTILSIFMVPNVTLAEEAPESVKKLAPTLMAYGENAVLVAAVKKQNSDGMTLDQIKARVVLIK